MPPGIKQQSFSKEVRLPIPQMKSKVGSGFPNLRQNEVQSNGDPQTGASARLEGHREPKY